MTSDGPRCLWTLGRLWRERDRGRSCCQGSVGTARVLHSGGNGAGSILGRGQLHQLRRAERRACCSRSSARSGEDGTRNVS